MTSTSLAGLNTVTGTYSRLVGNWLPFAGRREQVPVPASGEAGKDSASLGCL